MKQSEEHTSSIKHLAHDLNNIFTRILNSVELLKRKIVSNEEIVLLLNNIEAGTYLASEMIEETLVANENKTSPTRRININSIIQDVIRTFVFQQKEKTNFHLDLDPQLYLVKGKYSDFYRVFINLIINAVEAIKAKGDISVKTKSRTDHKGAIEITISDNGRGIDHEALPYIFNENFSTKQGSSISGVGLFIVKNIIEKYGGSINVTSKVGIGTKFRIILNAAATKAKRKKRHAKKILIAEDEGVLRELLAELLRSYNYKVTVASNGAEVLDALNSVLPDLMIIDQKMPVMDGIECIEQIKKREENIPIILAAGSPTDISDRTSFLKIDKILNKPYNFEELLSIIRELIG